MCICSTCFIGNIYELPQLITGVPIKAGHLILTEAEMLGLLCDDVIPLYCVIGLSKTKDLTDADYGFVTHAPLKYINMIESRQ
jgi:hypothetical protein